MMVAPMATISTTTESSTAVNSTSADSTSADSTQLQSKTSALVWAAVAALTLVAFVERWMGLGFELPHREDPDAAILHVAALHDLPAGVEQSDFAYRSTIYPFLFAGILVALPGSNYPVAHAPDAPLAEHMAAASEPTMRGRRLIALLSLLVVPSTFLLARRFFSDGWALLASTFAATSLLALHMSQQARPHGGLMGLSALAVASCLLLLRPATVWNYFVSGVATALALAALHSGLFVVPAFALAHFLGWRADRDSRRWLWLAIPAVLFAIAFVLAYPFIVFGDPLQTTSSGTLNFGQHAIRWESWNGRGFVEMLPAVFAFDPVLVVLSIAGSIALAASLIRSGLARVSRCTRDAALVIGVHALVTIAAFGMQEQLYARFLLPVLPLAGILAAYAVFQVARVAGRVFSAPTTRRAVAVACALLAIAMPAWASSWYARIRARPDTAMLAAHWIEEHVPPSSEIVAIDFTVSLPILQERAGLAEVRRWSLKPWQRYQLDILHTDIAGPHWNVRQIVAGKMRADGRIDRTEVLERMTQLGAHWAVVTVPTESDAKFDETRAAIRELAGEPVARFYPFDPALNPPPTLERDVNHEFVWRMLKFDGWGQPLEIYRLPTAAK